MMRNLKNNLWIPILLIVLCGCIYIFSKDKCESVFPDTEKKSKEDRFVYQGESYEKVGEDVYEKNDFPEAVQSVLQEEKCESVFSDTEKKSKEDWFVYKDFLGEGEFYVKAGDVYKKSDFPEAVQLVLQEEGNKCYYLKKEENRLITLAMEISRKMRPCWDRELLLAIGFQSCKTDKDTGRRVLGGFDLRTAPMFGICAVK